MYRHSAESLHMVWPSQRHCSYNGSGHITIVVSMHCLCPVCLQVALCASNRHAAELPRWCGHIHSAHYGRALELRRKPVQPTGRRTRGDQSCLCCPELSACNCTCADVSIVDLAVVAFCVNHSIKTTGASACLAKGAETVARPWSHAESLFNQLDAEPEVWPFSLPLFVFFNRFCCAVRGPCVQHSLPVQPAFE
jgi:hypothetical protein